MRETSAWRRLEWHLADVRHANLRELFDGDPTRGERLAAEAAGLYLDYSKHLLTDETLELLRKLAAERRLRERARALVGGDAGDDPRAAQHVALRMPRSRSVVVEGVDIVRTAHEELDRMYQIAERVRSGTWVGATGSPIRAVVEIAAGGSQLAVELAHEALRGHRDPQRACRFVSNVDPVALAAVLDGLEPAETLFVIVAKELNELEALVNAEAAVAWLRNGLGGDAATECHLVVVTARGEAASALGASPENVLGIPDWLDESHSLCSAAGLSACISLGPTGFSGLLAGFHAMDDHFAKSPLGGNLPAIAGLIAVWYRHFLAAETLAVVPYGEALRLLPAYVQQLAAASGGRSVTATDEPVETPTARVVWGATGTSAQAAVLPFLHRSAVLCPVDFVGVARPSDGEPERHDLLAANLLAQAESLAFGRGSEGFEEADEETEVIRYDALPGNRPSSVILARRLEPETLGALLAFYEHSFFTQAAIWGIDAFGRRRVEHAEELAARIAPELGAGWKRELMHDSSTNALVRHYRRLRDARG